MAFDFMPPVEGGAKGLCHRCRATKPRDAFGPSPKPNRARDHICLSCRAEMDAAPARRGRPKGVKRQPNVCTGCSKHVAERIQGEWICAPCRAKKSVAYKHRVGIHKARPAPVVPSDVPDRTWRAIEERNARDAWRYWVKVKAPKAWLDAYHHGGGTVVCEATGHGRGLRHQPKNIAFDIGQTQSLGCGRSSATMIARPSVADMESN